MAYAGERIRRLRLLNGFGQVDLAERTGLPTGTISMLENGRSEVTFDIAEIVSKELGCEPRYLLLDEKIHALTRPWLRAYADAPKRQVDQQVADLTTAVEAIEILNLQRVPDTLPLFAGDPADESQIEDFASEVRSAASLHEGEVVSNAIRAAERLGCFVLPMGEEMGRHVGLSARVNLAPVICVSRPSTDPEKHVPGDRQRYTVAHELGHLTMHADMAPPASALEASTIEKQAHLFAAAFLAPADAMHEELTELGGRVTLQTLTKIKERWGISVKALVTRFKSMGVIDTEHARSLYKQISARGWNKVEPVDVRNESGVWLEKALAKWQAGTAFQAEKAITAARRETGLDEAHFERWTNWSPIDTEDPGVLITVRFSDASRSSDYASVEGSVTPIRSGRAPRRRTPPNRA
jgi:Zn-dependent peptidase ImmA (M78 family)